MSFKDMVHADNANVFMNLNEFAETRTVVYDGERYEDIPVVLTGLKEQDRKQGASDHAQGLYLVSKTMHCRASDLGGNQPEKGQRIKISDPNGSSFFRSFYVAESVCEIGMLRVELEAIEE